MRDKEAEWKYPRFASLPSELLQVYVFDSTEEAEQALIQARDDIQEQRLGPNDGGASVQLIRLAILEARGINTTNLRSYRLEGDKEEAQLLRTTTALGLEHVTIRPSDSYAKEVASFATQNQQVTNKEESDKAAQKEQDSHNALQDKERETNKVNDELAAKEKTKQLKPQAQVAKLQHIEERIQSNPKFLDEVKSLGSEVELDTDNFDTIQQAETAIKELQRQKDAHLAVMNPQLIESLPSPVTNNEEDEVLAPKHREKDKQVDKKIPVHSKRHLDAPDLKSVPPTFFKTSNKVWAELSLTTTEKENVGVDFEMTADAQGDPAFDFQVLLDAFPISVTGSGLDDVPKPDSLEIGCHRMTFWFTEMAEGGVLFTKTSAIVNQLPKVRHFSPFTVSLLTKRIGNRLSYNGDTTPKNDWPRYTCTPKEAETFTFGNTQRKIQKLEGEMRDLLENLRGNKLFPTCRFWPNESCALGTKCCLQYYHDPKRARSSRHHDKSDTTDRSAPGESAYTIDNAPSTPLVPAHKCKHMSTDNERSYVKQHVPYTIQEDPAEGGVATLDRWQGAEEAGAPEATQGQDQVTVWVAPTSASATDKDLVSQYPPHPHSRTLPLYTTNRFDENNTKTKISQTVTTPNTEGIWTTMPTTRATRQIDDRNAKTLDNGKLKLAVNIYIPV